MRQILLAWAGVLLLGGFSGAVYAGTQTVFLQVDPPVNAFGTQPVGTISAEMTVRIIYPAGSGPTIQIASVSSGGPNADAFDVSGICNGVELDPGQDCTLSTAFEPEVAGDLLANLLIDCHIVAVVTGISVICEDPTATATTFTLNTLINYFTGTGVAAAPIPTLGQWGITLLALSLAAFMITKLRKTHG